MAAKTSTVVGLEIVRGHDDAAAGDTTGAVRSGILYVNAGGQAVTGGTDTLDTVLATAIQNELRNGRTVTARYFCLARNALTRSSAGVYTRLAGTTSGTTTCSINPVSSADYSSNANVAATDTFDEPYGIFVTWSEA